MQKTGNRQDPGMSSGCKQHHQTLRRQQSVSNVFCRRQETDKIPGCLLAANGITKHCDVSKVSAMSSVEDRKQTRSRDVFWLQTASPNIATSATCQQHLLSRRQETDKIPGCLLAANGITKHCDVSKVSAMSSVENRK